MAPGVRPVTLHPGQAPSGSAADDAEDLLELWRVAAQQSEDAVFGLTQAGRVSGWTHGAARLFGYQIRQARGMAAELLFAPDERDGHRERFGRVVGGETLERVQANARRRDGMLVPVALTLAPFDDGRGICAIARDVTERQVSQQTLVESQKQLSEVQRLSHFGLWLWHAPSDTVQMSDELYRIHGLSPLEFDGRMPSRIALAHPDDRPSLARELRRALSGRSTFALEYRVIRPGGAVRWVYERATVEMGEDGGPVGLRGICQDVTDRQEAAESLRRQTVLLQMLQRITVAANDASDQADALHRCMRQICFQFDWPVGHALMLGPGRIVEDHLWHLADPDRFASCRLAAGANSPSGGLGVAGRVLESSGPVWLPDLPGSSAEVLSAAQSGLRSGFGFPVAVDGELAAVVELFSLDRREPDQQLMDATAQGALQLGRVVGRIRARDHRAMHDALTNLPNRNLFIDRLGHALRGLGRSPAQLAVMFIDLDNFKLINDSLGHDVGDRVLTTIAQRLVRVMRQGDTAGRFGGDEFLILCERLPSDQPVHDIADRLLRTLAEPIVLEDELRTVVTGSIGIVIAGSPDVRPEDLIRDADAAMYRAKEEGRGRFHVFHAGIHDRASRKLAIGNELRAAVENRELRLVYQPQIRLSDGRLLGVEALVRWDNPNRGLLGPAEWIPVAEETQLIVPIGDWILHESCRRGAAWLRGAGGSATRGEFKICVNVSAVQLARPEWKDAVLRALSQNDLDPASLCIEITESVLIGAPGRYLDALHRLRLLGVTVAIDDFGTGYSSLAYLRQFPIDVIKIAKDFIDDLGHGDARAQAIVRAVVQLSEALGVVSVAEGVETLAQAEELRAIGCEAAQGFYFSRAKPDHEITELFRASSRAT